MPRVFEVSWEGQKATHTGDYSPLCEWVRDGEGTASIKLDGTACLIKDGACFARYDAKHGKAPPPDFVPCQPDADPVTGHWPGWVPILNADGTPKQGYKWHIEAFKGAPHLTGGTYELCGPHFQTNPYRLGHNQFFKHGDLPIDVPDRSMDAIRVLLETLGHEGIVFAHPDRRMAKVTASEFGIDWKATDDDIARLVKS